MRFLSITLMMVFLLSMSTAQSAMRPEISAADLSLDPEWQIVETSVMNWSPHNQVLITYWRSDRTRQTLQCIEHYNKRMEITRSYCK